MNNKSIERFQGIFGELKGIGEKLLVDLGDSSLLLERVRQKPRVMVVGEFNVGKSSLINSALGEVLLPVGVTPTTSLITVMEKGPYQVKIKPIGEKDTINIEPGKPQMTGYGIPDKYFDWEGFKNLLTDQKNIEKIEKVQIYNPAVPESMIVIDTPGINDLSKARSELIYGLMPTADIVLFVISALKPFSESERVFLEERLLANDLKKIIFVVNRMDEISADERSELLEEVEKNITEALNTSFSRINEAIKQTLYPPIKKVQIFGVSAKDIAPISSEAPVKGIGFETSKTLSKKGFSQQNRALWEHILKLTTASRDTEVELTLHHFLRRGSMRIHRALSNLSSTDVSSRNQMMSRLKENGEILAKMRDLMKKAEGKIQETEESLKGQIHSEIEKSLKDLLNAFRLQRDPATVNQKLKQLYEYIVTKMKSTLEDLYSQLGNDFDAVLDDKRFVEERELNIQYDFSDVPQKIVSSLSFAYLAAIFFGISVGLFAGVAYFASQVISNKRSLKEYFQHATVSEETLEKVKAELISKTDNEIEYAVDFVRQSIVQRVDVVQRDTRNITFSLSQAGGIELVESRKKLEEILVKIHSFLVKDNESSKSGA